MPGGTAASSRCRAEFDRLSLPSAAAEARDVAWRSLILCVGVSRLVQAEVRKFQEVSTGHGPPAWARRRSSRNRQCSPSETLVSRRAERGLFSAAARVRSRTEVRRENSGLPRMREREWDLDRDSSCGGGVEGTSRPKPRLRDADIGFVSRETELGC